MRKRLFMALIFGFALIATIATPMLVADSCRRHRNNEIRCNIHITLNESPPPTWNGKIKGDIRGTFGINFISANFLDSDLNPVDPDDPNSNTVWEIYCEYWYIVTKKGTITALQSGVWSFENFVFLSNGPVVDATGKYEYLVGSTMYVKGITNNPFVDSPVEGDGQMWITL